MFNVQPNKSASLFYEKHTWNHIKVLGKVLEPYIILCINTEVSGVLTVPFEITRCVLWSVNKWLFNYGLVLSSFESVCSIRIFACV